MPNNNTLATADLLQLTSTPFDTSGFVGSSDRDDYYRFVLNSNAEVTFDLKGLSEAAQIALIFDTNGDGLVGNDEIIGTDGISDFSSSIVDRSIVQDLTAGTYWLRVYTADTDENTNYTLTASATSLPTLAPDPGNSLSTARPLGLLGTPQVFSDAVSVADPKDFYQFTVNQNSRVVFSLTGMSEAGQIRLIADLNGDGLVTNDEIIEADGISDFSSSNVDRSIVQDLTAGTYWVETYIGDTDENTAYTLTASATALPTLPYDPGNTLGTARNLGSLTTQTQTFTDAVGILDQRDYYQFAMTQTGQATFTLTGLSEAGQIRLIADLNGNGVVDSGEVIETDGVSDFSSSTVDRSIIQNLGAGNYWLEVYTGDTDENTGYRLTAQSSVAIANLDTRLYWHRRAPGSGITATWQLGVPTGGADTDILRTSGAFLAEQADGSSLALNDLNWDLAGTGDFNNDGFTDLVWRNYGPTGAVAVWYMQDDRRIGGTFLDPLPDTAWELQGVADLDGDGDDDLIWRNNGSTVQANAGLNAIWLLENGQRVDGAFITPEPDLNWSIGGVGDFDGDGRENDILWRNETSNPNDPNFGVNAVWFLDNAGLVREGGAFINSVPDSNWVVGGVADFNNDGSSDILWRNTTPNAADPNFGINAVWFMNGVTRTSGAFLAAVPDSTWDVVV